MAFQMVIDEVKPSLKASSLRWGKQAYTRLTFDAKQGVQDGNVRHFGYVSVAMYVAGNIGLFNRLDVTKARNILVSIGAKKLAQDCTRALARKQ